MIIFESPENNKKNSRTKTLKYVSIFSKSIKYYIYQDEPLFSNLDVSVWLSFQLNNKASEKEKGVVRLYPHLKISTCSFPPSRDHDIGNV